MNGFVDCRLRFLGVEHPPLLFRRLPRGLRGLIERREEYPACGTGFGVSLKTVVKNRVVLKDVSKEKFGVAQ